MSDRELALVAIKYEAKRNPENKLVYGDKVFTYAEIAGKIEGVEALPEPIEQAVVVPMMNLLEKSPLFRNKVLKMVEG
jgi:hypothetical protein